MRGGKPTLKRTILPDERYNSATVAKFINRVMLAGKRETAKNIVYKAMDTLEKATNRPALEAFETALKNASPLVEVRSKRIGGATYQVPMEVRPDRKMALAMRWIINAARDKQGKSMQDFLASELLDAYNSTGTAMKKREDLHKMAEANKAFAHFARF
ncbi:MAG TPA: 30S ribosomal protein S7 [Patescibacteria group bacterium]